MAFPKATDPKAKKSILQKPYQFVFPNSMFLVNSHKVFFTLALYFLFQLLD